MGDAFKVMNFVTEKELAELKDARGERVEDGTLAPDRPLFEILKENKEKKDAEFNERFRNLPPKALDDDEMEFLEAVDKHKRESDREAAQKEAQELANFQAAILARTVRVAPAKPGPVKPAGHGTPAPVAAAAAAAAAPAKQTRAAPVIAVRIAPKKAKLNAKVAADGTRADTSSSRREPQGNGGAPPQSQAAGKGPEARSQGPQEKSQPGHDRSPGEALGGLQGLVQYDSEQEDGD